ncbi:hypothetical protein CALCODRAFT_513471, partial [Calocera cornea HHB12733]
MTAPLRSPNGKRDDPVPAIQGRSHPPRRPRELSELTRDITTLFEFSRPGIRGSVIITKEDRDRCAEKRWLNDNLVHFLMWLFLGNVLYRKRADPNNPKNVVSRWEPDQFKTLGKEIVSRSNLFQVCNAALVFTIRPTPPSPHARRIPHAHPDADNRDEPYVLILDSLNHNYKSGWDTLYDLLDAVAKQHKTAILPKSKVRVVYVKCAEQPNFSDCGFFPSRWYGTLATNLQELDTMVTTLQPDDQKWAELFDAKDMQDERKKLREEIDSYAARAAKGQPVNLTDSTLSLTTEGKSTPSARTPHQPLRGTHSLGHEAI